MLMFWNYKLGQKGSCSLKYGIYFITQTHKVILGQAT